MKSKEIKVKAKRGKQSLVVLIDEKATLKQLKTEIQQMVNVTGGLKPLDDSDELMIDSEPQIEIPEPSFPENDSSDSDSDTADQKGTAQNKQNGLENLIPDIELIKIGKPADMSNPTGTNFTDVLLNDDTSIDRKTLLDMGIGDGAVIAFAMQNEDFLVIEPIVPED